MVGGGKVEKNEPRQYKVSTNISTTLRFGGYLRRTTPLPLLRARNGRMYCMYMGFSVFEIAKNNNYNKLLIEKYLQNKGLRALYLARKTTPDMIKEK